MIGRSLREARQTAGLTQEQVSTRARVDRSYLSQLEGDRKSPTLETLHRICRVLNVRMSVLIARAEAEENSETTSKDKAAKRK